MSEEKKSAWPWLDRHKVIFETIVAASLTIMGVLVSIAAVVVSVNANKLMYKQYELDKYGAEPVFTVEWEMGTDGLPYYIVKNKGAEIYDVQYHSGAHIKVYLGTPDEEDFMFEINPSDDHQPRDFNFDRQKQSFSMSAYRWFSEESSARIKHDLVKIGVSGWIEYINITIYFRNYLYEDCESELRLTVFDEGDFDYVINPSPLVHNPMFAVAPRFAISIEENPSEEILQALSRYLDDDSILNKKSVLGYFFNNDD